MLIDLNNIYFNSFHSLEIWTFVPFFKKSKSDYISNYNMFHLGVDPLCGSGLSIGSHDLCFCIETTT
jgi:hypothetical protein